jgi:nitrate reductase delta subunit
VASDRKPPDALPAALDSEASAPFDQLAEVLTYPVDGYEGRFKRCVGTLEARDKSLARMLEPLARHMEAVSESDLEELFTRTFDINPQCTLELGWQLYGEDYNRGAFLVRMRELMREKGVEEGTELPDHIMHVLPVLGRMSREEASDFSLRFALPAVNKMLEGFSDNENPFRCALETVRGLLVHSFGISNELAGAAYVQAGPYEGMPGGYPAQRKRNDDGTER